MNYGRIAGLAITLLAAYFAEVRAKAQVAKEDPPSEQAVADLLRKEPINLESWPVWRGRLLAWMHDRTRRPDAAYQAARNFMHSQADAQDNLPPALAKDHAAWYLLGGAYLADQNKNVEYAQLAAKAEKALRRSLELDPTFARAHRNLALAILFQAPRGQADPRAQEVDSELQEAARLDPSLPLNAEKGEVALVNQNFAEAEAWYRKAVRETPEDLRSALGLAMAILQNRQRPGPLAPHIQPLVDRFPTNGELACFNSLALAADNHFGAASRELERARSLGADPLKMLSPQMVHEIQTRGAPNLPERFGWAMLYFAGFYAVVMLAMACAGLVLASRTRGNRALGLLQAMPEHLVEEGQVVRASGETMLAHLYAVALVVGLILFYLSMPFIIVGLLGTTALLVYLIFLGGRIPIKLVIIIIVVGLGAAWAVFKSLFSKPASGSFGLPKTVEEEPRLHQVLGDVARRVDTDPVHEVYVAPGSEIGVHQEGRGPFGMFGVKRRVLTLGLSTMRFLTVNELEAILAHEYAHFSHRDTFYSRFIYQVHLSIGQALWGMGQVGGNFTYFNPFYWFLFLYYKCYSLLSAGFSRSREFLADRMASSLYGSDVFASALTKVSTDGMLFEKTIYDSISGLLEKQESFVNMYEAFRHYRDKQLTKEQREEEHQKLMAETGSLFAQHPTIAERLQAVAELPVAQKTNATPALQLFRNPEETEKELTKFLTDYMAAVQQYHAQLAAQAASQ
jgi:Zn-dependent protease with chaperone function